jgi:hypothetical protein
MRFYKCITAIVLIGVCLMSKTIFSQETFESRKELNNYIFQNSDLENVTDGYFLEFNQDFTPELQDSFFSDIENEVRREQLLAYLKIMEDADVSGDFEMDSVLFPIMDRFYANNGVSPIAIPLFICDVRFDHLNESSYNEFSNWSSTEPFPQLTQNDLDYKHEVMTGFFADSLRNRNIKLYWNEDTYFTNTDRVIEKVNVIINGDSIRLRQNQIYDLKDHYTGTLTSIDISIQFDDETVENKTSKLFFTNAQEKNGCEEFIAFTSEENPWSSLGDFCNIGYLSSLGEEVFGGLAMPGIRFGVLWGCGETKELDKPYLILGGWGPYTDKSIINNAQNWPSTIQHAYWNYNQEGFINNLVGAGYDVIIAKIDPPNQSTIANSELIEELIKMINVEKFSNDSYEENIISGYSAGALSARLALQRMEKEHLEGINEHHHSKLFVSFDGEHGGANVALGLQHLVKYTEEHNMTTALLNQFLNPVPVPPATVWTLENYFNAYALHYILNAPLSRELLRYFHTETGTSSAQTIGAGFHPDRSNLLGQYALFDHPKNSHNPRYPAFTRNISISNGTSQSDISGTTSNHYPYPADESHLIFKHERSQRRWEASFLGSGTPWVFKYEEKSWGQWDIVEEARVHNALILDNAPGGTSFLAKESEESDINTVFQVLRIMEVNSTAPLVNNADFVDYEALYTFTPTILTHDIRNFDPSSTGGRLDYDMKAEGLMYQSLSDFESDPANPVFSSYWGYPHLAHPQDHYTNYTPFDAVFAWDQTNTVHIISSEAVYDSDGNEVGLLGNQTRGKWEEIHSPIKGVIKNFIVEETDFFNAFIQNRRYGWNAKSDYIYKADIIARNEIYAGKNVTQRTDFKPAEIQENADISFTACKSVNLKSGFHAQSGSTFHAKVNNDVCDCGGSKSVINTSTNEYGNTDTNRGKTQEVLSSQDKDVNSIDIRLYPNPGKKHVNLEIQEDGIQGFMYMVFDMRGKQIIQKQVNKNYTTLSLEKGVYIVKIKVNNQWHTRKLIMY